LQSSGNLRHAPCVVALQMPAVQQQQQNPHKTLHNQPRSKHTPTVSKLLTPTNQLKTLQQLLPLPTMCSSLSDDVPRTPPAQLTYPFQKQPPIVAAASHGCDTTSSCCLAPAGELLGAFVNHRQKPRGHSCMPVNPSMVQEQRQAAAATTMQPPSVSSCLHSMFRREFS
jgi:hypothetical protein